MTRPLRVGDRVTATGTVIGGYPLSAIVKFDGDADTYQLMWKALTRIAPDEPPLGSVVIKDGVAWTRYASGWYAFGEKVVGWDDLIDGEVIFTSGGES